MISPNEKAAAIVQTRNDQELMISVNASQLLKLLRALNGPGHLIAELQATRGPLIGDDNPINLLIKQYNSEITSITEKRLTAAAEQKEMNEAHGSELWNADPNCEHNVVCAPGGGVKCTKCLGWFCY